MDQQTVCPQCGTQIAPSASFCTQCGATLEAALRSEPVQAQPSEVQTEPPTNPQNEEQPSPTAPPTPGDSRPIASLRGNPIGGLYPAPQSQQAYSQPQGQSYQQPYQAPQSQQAYEPASGRSLPGGLTRRHRDSRLTNLRGSPIRSPQGRPYSPGPQEQNGSRAAWHLSRLVQECTIFIWALPIGR